MHRKLFLVLTALTSIIVGEAHGALYPAKAIYSDGYIYVVGTQNSGVGATTDFAVVKYNLSGESVWVKSYDQAVTDEEATCAAVDQAGNIYVGGWSKKSTGAKDADYLILKYSPAGTLLWSSLYDGGMADYCYSVAADSAGNVYATGKSAGQNSGWDWATVKLNSTGHQEWDRRYNGPGNSFDEAIAIAVTGPAIYVAGSSCGNTKESDYLLVKYNLDGFEQWERRYDGPASKGDWVNDMAIDGEGNICLTGSSTGLDSGEDYATVKYSPAGDSLWIARYNGEGNFNDSAIGVVVDDSGYVYITGHSWGKSINLATDFVTIKYSATGQPCWVARYNGTGNFSDEPRAIVITSERNICVTGFSYGEDQASRDMATVLYSQAGEQLWVKTQNREARCEDIAETVATDNHGNIYVAGYSEGTLGDDQLLFFKYGGQPAAGDGILRSSPVEHPDPGQPLAFALFQNYPNPFNPTTSITYDLPMKSHIRLTVFNAMGQVVANLVGREQNAGNYRVSWNGTNLDGSVAPSGIYFYHLEGDGFAKTMKMTLMK